MRYPLAPRSAWWGDADYVARGGRLVRMSPTAYLRAVRPLRLDEASEDNVSSLVDHVRRGGVLDPLTIYADGREDGRHRAVMAIRLGMKSVPVIVFRQTRDRRRRRRRT